MTKFFLVLACLFFMTFGGGSMQSTQSSRVWICTGSGAYAYHNNRACSGLNNCKATIIQVTEKEAIEKYSRKKCKKCYRLNKAFIYSVFLNSEDDCIDTSFFIE